MNDLILPADVASMILYEVKSCMWITPGVSWMMRTQMYTFVVFDE